MIGTPDIMSVRVWTGFPVPDPMIDPPQPTGNTKVAAIRQRPSGYPVPVASYGPDWDIGDSYYPLWTPNNFKDEEIQFEEANYGFMGGVVKYANNSTPGQPEIAGSAETATAKVRTIRWDPEALPGFDPRIPPWNNLPSGSWYQHEVPSVKRHVTFDGSAQKQNVQAPMEFSPPGAASLVQNSLYNS